VFWRLSPNFSNGTVHTRVGASRCCLRKMPPGCIRTRKCTASCSSVPMICICCCSCFRKYLSQRLETELPYGILAISPFLRISRRWGATGRDNVVSYSAEKPKTAPAPMPSKMQPINQPRQPETGEDCTAAVCVTTVFAHEEY